MNSLIARLMLSTAILRSPEAEGGTPPAAPEMVLGGKVEPEPAVAEAAAKTADTKVEGDASTTLFPGDKPAADPDKPADPAAKVEDKAVEWKEYTPDAAKTVEENAAAKKENDKTKPEDKLTDDEKKERALDTVPEDGKYQLTMPQGIVGLDEKLLAAVGPTLAKHKLTTRQAQELTDEYVKQGQEKAAEEYAGWVKIQEGWVGRAKADPDIGGDKWNQSVRDANRFIDAQKNPELVEYLKSSGGGNHPALIKAFVNAGRMVKEDQPESGGAGGSGTRAMDPAHILFKNDVPKG